MRIISFATQDSEWKSPRMGIILDVDGRDSGDRLDCEKLFEPADRPNSPLAWFDTSEKWFQTSRDTVARLGGDANARAEARRKGWLVPSKDAYWFAPVPRPGKIVCVGLNYRDHAAESGLAVPATPVIFSKFSSCVIAPGEPVVVPRTSEKVDYEAELAVVIGRHAKRERRPRLRLRPRIHGVQRRHRARFQFGDGQWQRGKSCGLRSRRWARQSSRRTRFPIRTLRISLTVNGNTMQDSNTSQLIFRIPQLIEFITQSISLEPGDVIATGTPAGVGFARKPPVFLKPGDVMDVHIEKIGGIGNPVVAEH
jgi:2-keto-4-pentenoate hydratase/2-oxohepta-3-ene-1,7-dioic acid hydratase in catechol pathway